MTIAGALAAAACSQSPGGEELFAVEQPGGPTLSVTTNDGPAPASSATGQVVVPKAACDSLATLSETNRQARTASVPLELSARRAIDTAGLEALDQLASNSGPLATEFVWLAEVERTFDAALHEAWGPDGLALQSDADLADEPSMMAYVASRKGGDQGAGLFVNGAFVTVEDRAVRWDSAFIRLWFACHTPPPGWEILVPGPPGLSPAGALVFTRPGADGVTSATLHRMDLGTRVADTLLTDQPRVSAPRMSPSEHLLALIQTGPDGESVLTIRPKDGSPTRTLSAPEDLVSCPSWRGDSAAIVVRRRAPADSGVGWQLASIDLASGVATALTGPDSARMVQCGAALLDGTIVAPKFDPASATTVLVMNPGAATTSAPLVAIADCSIGLVTPSPDNARIAFSTNCADPYGDGLWLVSISGGEPTRVVTGVIQGIGWSPDSTWMTFTHRAVGSDQPLALWAIQPDGANATQLDPGPALDPTWEL